MLNDPRLWKALTASRRSILIAGPCVIESPELCFKVASTLQRVTEKIGVTYVFKASFDKADRTSAKSFRGPGLQEGLDVLAAVRTKVGVPYHRCARSRSRFEAPPKQSIFCRSPRFMPTNRSDPRCRGSRANCEPQKGPILVSSGNGASGAESQSCGRKGAVDH